jgi:membrane protease YdiL (CAAX protease family)
VIKAVPLKKILSPLIPYPAVIIGFLIFRNAWLTVLGYHAGMILVLLLSNTRPPLKTIFKGNHFWIPFITFLIGGCAGVVLYLLWPDVSLPPDINVFLRSLGLTGLSWLVFVAYFSLVNPFIEEYYWRGYLGSTAKGITLNDVLFSGYHLIVLAGLIGNIWLFVVFTGLTLGAWFWRQMNRLNGGLLASVVSHLAADTAIVLTIYYFSVK